MPALNIHHLGLAVSKLKESTHFFVECLEWKIVDRKPHYPAIFVSSGKFTITLWQTQDDAEEFDQNNNVGLHYLALQAESEIELQQIFERVRNHSGVNIEFPPQTNDEDMIKHFMITEPSGIRIEFICSMH